jgi:hypothetical protein
MLYFGRALIGGSLLIVESSVTSPLPPSSILLLARSGKLRNDSGHHKCRRVKLAGVLGGGGHFLQAIERKRFKSTKKPCFSCHDG